ncbi:SPOR domain-containing protein [Helicobacter bilis]
MPIQDSKTQSINPQNTPQTESSHTNQTSNVANSPKVENKEIDSTPFEISEEELPEFEDTTQSKTKEAKHETKPKPQPTKDETLDSAFVGITPKHIDNTESIKDIDEAMQRLKDSTENLAKKAQNEIKNQAKENTQQTAIDSKTDSKVENMESKKPRHADSKQLDSNNTATNDTKPSDTKAGNVKAGDIKINNTNKGNFMISLNVFSDENRAKSFKDDNQSIVKDTNYSIDIVPTDKGYRVALRGFKTYDEAKAFIAKYDIKGYVAQESK